VEHSIRSLHGFTVRATDGDIGHAIDFYFDDEKWAVRYLVIDAGSWFGGRRVLVSPIAITDIRQRPKAIDVSISRDQIRNSPNVSGAMPITRGLEAQQYQYYGWPYYWAGPAVWGNWETSEAAAAAPRGAPPAVPAPNEAHLHSTNVVEGYEIQATDGEIGRVEDFYLDDRDWHIDRIEVYTPGSSLGEELFIPSQQVTRFDWVGRKLFVDFSREQMASKPTTIRASRTRVR